MPDGTLVPWDPVYRGIVRRGIICEPPKSLIISGCVFDAGLTVSAETGAWDLRNIFEQGNVVHISPPLPEGWSVGQTRLDSSDARQPGAIMQCLGLLIQVGSEPSYGPPSWTFDPPYKYNTLILVLYLSPKGASTYERIGVGQIVHSSGRDLRDELVKNSASDVFSNVRKQTVRIV